MSGFGSESDVRSRSGDVRSYPNNRQRSARPLHPPTTTSVTCIKMFVSRCSRLHKSPQHSAWIDDAGNHAPTLLIGRECLDAITTWQIEARNVLPPPIQVGDKHVHYAIVCPVLDIVILQDEGECPSCISNRRSPSSPAFDPGTHLVARNPPTSILKCYNCPARPEVRMCGVFLNVVLS